MLQKALGLINMDVCVESESKNLIVVLRILQLIFILQLLVNAGVLAFSGFSLLLAFFSAAFAGLYVISLIVTYKLPTRPSYYSFFTITLLWSIFASCTTCWSCEFHLFTLLLLVVSFFVPHNSLKIKAAFSAFLCAVTLFLRIASVYMPSPQGIEAFQVFFFITNVVIVFGGITITCWFFSSRALDGEIKLMLYNQRLQQDAATDLLTGLPNRRKVIQEIEAHLTKVKNGQESTFSIAIGDIDFFKKVNDSLGHECGDVVLKELSKLFLEFMKGLGSVGRWGGEEFMFVFNGMNGDEANAALFELMRKLHQTEIVYKKETLKVTLTFGLEEYDIRYDLRNNIKRADDKLYMGKNSGRDKVVY